MPIAILEYPPALTVYKELSAMYLQNKYSKYYYSIINRAKSRVITPDLYLENHHIIPKSLGGDNNKNNLVKLTAREHYICHLLLTKFTKGAFKHKMLFAANMMSKSKNLYQSARYVPTSRLYEMIKKEYARAMSIQNTGRVMSESEKLKKSIAMTGKKTGRTKDTFTNEWKANISAAKKGKTSWNLPNGHSEKTKELQSSIAKNRPKKECPHCHKLIAGPSNFTRWHGNNCKSN